MVAASGARDGFHPLISWGLLAFVVAGTVACILMGTRTMLIRRLPVGKSPDALVERAREIIKKTGYVDEPVDSAFGFDYDAEFLDYVRSTDKTVGRWARLDTYNPVVFWYRQSPQPLEHIGGWLPFFLARVNAITPNDPPLQFSGDILVRLDGEGRLRSLEVVPPEVIAPSQLPAATDWMPLVADAGFDISQLIPDEPRRNPPFHSDTQAAWSGALPRAGDIPVRIEAAAYRGRPVVFQLAGPWARPSRMTVATLPVGQQIGSWFVDLLLLVLLAGGSFFARRNLRMGRGDRRGATRLVVVISALAAVAWIFGEHHVAASELRLLIVFAGISLVFAGVLAMLYLALEPVARRRWPQLLVSWSRLASGQWRDALVGRDVLVGCATGVAAAFLGHLSILAPNWLAHPQDALTLWVPLIGPSAFILGIPSIVFPSVLVTLSLFFFAVLAWTVLRNERLAAIASILLFGAPILLSHPEIQLEMLWVVVPIAIVYGLVTYLALMRVGWLAFFVGALVVSFLGYPLTFQSSAWYAPIGYFGLTVIAALTFYGFWTSLGGHIMPELDDQRSPAMTA
jgi:serine/threonine-protein kinase